MDEGDRLWHRLVTGEVGYPEVFESAVQQFPQLSTVRLADIEQVELPVAPEPSRVAGWLFKLLLRAFGLSSSEVKGIGRRASSDVASAEREQAIVLHSIDAYVGELAASASSSDLWQSRHGRALMYQHLVRRFGLKRVNEGEAGALDEALFAGETSYGDIFEEIAGREPRLDIATIGAVREAVAALPVMDRGRRPGTKSFAVTSLDDYMAVIVLVSQMTGPRSEAQDELLRSRFATSVAQVVLADRFGLDPPETSTSARS